jgi:predicted TIM-barrel fold metal-dependent hydrolase
MAQLAIPEALEPFAGRIIDVDTHESIPLQLFEQEFGPITRDLAKTFQKSRPYDPSGVNFPGYTRDDCEINADTVWKTKGSAAPGSTDPRRRLAVMDLTGVKRQLMFPGSLAFPASFLYNNPVEYGFFPDYHGDRKAYAVQLLEANNDWAIRAAKVSERVRPVAPAYGSSVAELLASTKRLLDNGIRAFWLMSSVLPGGKSPASNDLDPFWKLLTDRDATAVLHIGSEGGFLKTDSWSDARAFEGYKVNVEFNLSPWHLSTLHLPSQNFLATMISGGVFERHPTLRFGCIELGAHWIGPLAAMLDMWHANNRHFGAASVDRLPKKPSEYIRRNVRVSAFDFENVDQYIDTYGLDDVYCYSSDFPHVEGGKDPMVKFAKRLERLGPAIMEKFFVMNGTHLLPG